MAGLADVLRVVIEKSWTLGVLLLVTGGGAWFVSRHGQHVPTVVDEWDVLAALLGLALIALSIITAALATVDAAIGDLCSARSAAKEAVQNLATLDFEELAALAELLEAGALRVSIHHGSILAGVWRKGVLVVKRRETPLQSICEVHPAVMELKDEIIAQWRKNTDEGRSSRLIDQGSTWMGR